MKVHPPSKTFLEQMKEIAFRAGLRKEMPEPHAVTEFQDTDGEGFPDTVMDPDLVPPPIENQVGFQIGGKPLFRT